MPYRYGGYIDPSELQQAAGGNPWYNPMSKYPDIGGGIRSLVNQMMLMKQAKEQRMQQEEEAKRKAAKEAEEARRWRLEYLQKADAARRQYELTAGKQQAALTPEERVAQIEAEAAARARGAGTGKFKPPEQPKPEKPERADADVVKAFDGAITDLSATIEEASAPTWKEGAPPDVNLAALKKARTFLRTMRAKFLGKQKISSDEMSRAWAIISNPEGIGKTPLAEPPGGQIGQVLGGQPATKTAIPKEVRAYLLKHPEANLADVLAMYTKWKSGK